MHADACRYERKFDATTVGLAVARLLVRLHPAHFRQAYPTRYINNIYFDTPSLADYSAHINGASARSKIRLRWYGPADEPITRGTIETKTRVGQVGYKRCKQLGCLDIGRSLAAKEIAEAVRATIGPDSLVEQLARRVPTLFNRYRREYYVSADRRFRITLDSELEFEQVNGRPNGTLRRWREYGIAIIELKYDAALDEAACEVAGQLPFRLERMSKYIRGVQRLIGSRDSLTFACY